MHLFHTSERISFSRVHPHASLFVFAFSRVYVATREVEVDTSLAATPGRDLIVFGC